MDNKNRSLAFRSMDFGEMDENLLSSIIRYLGHVLDKITKTRWAEGKGARFQNNLTKALMIWRQRNFDVSEDILWAERVLQKYNTWNERKKPIITHRESKTANDLFKVIRQRRSVRCFKDKDVEKRKLVKILEAGRWAPCSCNRQSWKFVVQRIQKNTATQEHEVLSLLSAQTLSKRGCVLIYVGIDQRLYGETEKFAAAMDAASAIENMLLTAHNLGLGGCWIYLADLVDQEQLRRNLDLEDYYYVYSLILLGYPIEYPEEPARRPLKKMIKFIGFDVGEEKE